MCRTAAIKHFYDVLCCINFFSLTSTLHALKYSRGRRYAIHHLIRWTLLLSSGLCHLQTNMSVFGTSIPCHIRVIIVLSAFSWPFCTLFGMIIPRTFLGRLTVDIQGSGSAHLSRGVPSPRQIPGYAYGPDVSYSLSKHLNFVWICLRRLFDCGCSYVYVVLLPSCLVLSTYNFF